MGGEHEQDLDLDLVSGSVLFSPFITVVSRSGVPVDDCRIESACVGGDDGSGVFAFAQTCFICWYFAMLPLSGGGFSSKGTRLNFFRGVRASSCTGAAAAAAAAEIGTGVLALASGLFFSLGK